MASTKSTQKDQFPVPAYNYRVTIDGHAMGFSEVSGLQIEYETVAYAHGLSYWEGEQVQKFPVDKPVTVTFKRGTVAGLRFLHEWSRQRKPRMVEVSLCDEVGIPIATWRIAKALPLKISAPTFDASTNEVAIETLEVMARGISIIDH
ncbi:MAG: phage tail protein [Planctomycetaceae bacterium]|nr:phage tail protein [Planctomycetaceae bacterium]MCB9950071.1 phage tail protein [Planctomycetaceae bacterium]